MQTPVTPWRPVWAAEAGLHGGVSKILLNMLHTKYTPQADICTEKCTENLNVKVMSLEKANTVMLQSKKKVTSDRSDTENSA